jgi:NTP pyrophosphatase (non-canonical NTP hydrolase)
MEAMTEHEELMTITSEECGEVIQACSKMLRFPSEQSTEMFKKELGDLYCMMEICIEKQLLTYTDLVDGSKAKRHKLKQWSNLEL